VELLAEQRIIESSEEEIYYTHFRILAALYDPAARDHLVAAHTGYMTKWEPLGRREWQDAYEQVRLNAAIRRDYQKLTTQTADRR